MASANRKCSKAAHAAALGVDRRAAVQADLVQVGRVADHRQVIAGRGLGSRHENKSLSISCSSVGLPSAKRRAGYHEVVAAATRYQNATSPGPASTAESRARTACSIKRELKPQAATPKGHADA